MRKPVTFALAAILSLAASGIVTTPAQAAFNPYTSVSALQGGNGKMIVIGGGVNWGNCDINMPGFPDFGMPDHMYPDFNYPDFNNPGFDIPDNSLPTPDYPETDIPDHDLSGFAAQVADLVNAERAKAGLRPLTVKKDVTLAAQTRSKELISSFSHTRPDGSSFSTALTQAGVSFKGSGENIAYGQTSPQKVMQDWMNSSGHRANILNSNFTSIGVGHYKNSAGVDYWTQLFTQ